MKSYQLANGDRVPALGLGTWKMADGSAVEAVSTAIDVGYRHFDCAHIYGNEQDVGQALAAAIDSKKVNRDELWITSKLWNDCHRPEHVRPALETTLKNLQIDAVDLYLMHWPVAHKPGVALPESAEDLVGLDQLPVIETWQAMEACVAAGLCKHIGVSNFSSKKLADLIANGTLKPEFNQVESHPFLQQSELFDFCRKHDIQFIAYSPLGSGDRPERMRNENEPQLFQQPQIIALAEQHALTPAQIILAWAVNRGTVAIPKSTHHDRMQQNLAAAAIELSAADMQIMTGLDRHYRFVDGRFCQLPGSSYTFQSLWDES